MLAVDKFKVKLHLRQSILSYSACVLFTKYRGRIQKFRGTGNLKHICKKELGRVCFVHDAAYSDSKKLAKYFELFYPGFWRKSLRNCKKP